MSKIKWFVCIGLMIGVFYLLYQKDTGWGVSMTAFIVFLAASDTILEFTLSYKEGLKIKQRLENINESFVQEIFLDTNVGADKKVFLQDRPIKNSVFAYWAPIVMTEGLSFTVSDNCLDLSLHFKDEDKSPEDTFTESNPLVVRYLKRI